MPGRRLTTIKFDDFRTWLRLDKQVKDVISTDTGHNGVSAGGDCPPVYHAFLTEDGIDKLKAVAGIVVRVISEN